MFRLVLVFLLFESIFTEKSKPADLTNEQLNRKIQALEDKYSKEITNLKDEYRKDIASLKNEHIKGITSLKDDHMKEITNLKIEHRKEITSLKDEVEALRKMTENGQKLNHRHGVRRAAGDQVERVAFDTHISGWVSNLGRNQPIVFPFVNTNIGNRYNRSTGVFYCDRSGIYVFFAQVLVFPGKPVYLQIVKNGGLISPIYANNPHALAHSATTAITHLQSGDSVWVRTDDYQESNLNGNILDDHYNSFGGFLLYSD